MIDPRRLNAGGAMVIPSPSEVEAQREMQLQQMQIQQTFATLQMCQNLVMSQYLYEEAYTQKNEDAKKLRTTALKLVQTFLDGQETVENKK